MRVGTSGPFLARMTGGLIVVKINSVAGHLSPQISCVITLSHGCCCWVTEAGAGRSGSGHLCFPNCALFHLKGVVPPPPRAGAQGPVLVPSSHPCVPAAGVRVRSLARVRVDTLFSATRLPGPLHLDSGPLKYGFFFKTS